MHPAPNQFPRVCLLTAALVLSTVTASAAPFTVLWWDSTPEYSGQAPNAFRQEFSDYLNAYLGGTVFTSTYVGSETPGTLATQLALNSYDVIVFDATSAATKFDASDLAAVRNHYSNNNRNLLFDGNLYVRSINFNETSDFPGVNGSTGGLTLNEVHQLAVRGGGIMIGTDHDCCQTDANEVLSAILPGRGFSGNTSPSTDGVFYGTDLLNDLAAVAPADLFNHYSSIPSQGIAPSGAAVDYLGNPLTLYIQLEAADFVGGTRVPYITTSWKPGSGSTGIDDPEPPPPPGTVPEPASMALLGSGLAGLYAASKWTKKRKAGE